MVVRSSSSREKGRAKQKEGEERKGRDGERRVQDNKPESSRRSAKLVKYALIYQWHAYQLPLLPTAMTIKPNQLLQTNRWRMPRPESSGGKREGVSGLPAGPGVRYPRSASISHKFDMICAEYDNGYQPAKLPKVPFLPLTHKYT